jgi:uncharacterized membrane protein YbhN (UPF0104 family)
MADTDVAEPRIPIREIPVEEPPLPRRARRPMDIARLVLTAVGVAAIVGLAVVAAQTLSGLGDDLEELGSRVPGGLIQILAWAASLVGTVLPPLLVVLLMVRGRVRTTVEVLVAGVLAAVVAALVSLWLINSAPDVLADAFGTASFMPTDPAEVVTDEQAGPVPPYPALLVAITTVTAWLDMKLVRQAALFAISASLAVGLLNGTASVAGTALAVGIGHLVGLGVRLVSGRPSTAPDGRAVAAMLQAEGYDVRSVRADQVDQHRRYVVETSHGPLGVLVLDRENEGAGMLGRLIAQVRTREEVLPREAVAMRAALDQTALLSLAVSQAGARTPCLRKALKVGSDAVALVYDHVPGRPLSDVPADEITDDMLHDLWRQLKRLHENQIAHRRVSGRSILVGDDGHIWLLNPSGGEIAAPDLASRVDLAQALVAVGLVVGAERAVPTAFDVLGPDRVASAVPLLQPIALARLTRRGLKGRRSLLSQLRDGVVARADVTESEVIRVERLRPLSLLTGLGAVVAVYLVGTQLTEAPLTSLIAEVEWIWVGVAVASMAVSFVGATWALLGFVPERVPFWRTFGAQVSLGFVRLIAPATVGNAAINIRLLARAGVSGPLAAASVAANQVGNVAVSIPLIIVLGIATGSSAAASLEPSPTTLAIIGGAVLLAALLLLMPPIRSRARVLWLDFAARGLPRLLDVLAKPRKLAEAAGGILLQVAALVFCFYASLQALGIDVNIAALAVVQLVGNTVGTAVPTPGGLGAVEAALTAGLTAIGVSSGVAVSGVLLFRIVSFWLPIAPGWICWTQMQKRGLL